MGILFHAMEEEMLCYSHMIDKVLPPIYLQDDSVVGKVNENLRFLNNEVYFSVRIGKGSSNKKSDKVYDKLLRRTKF